MTRLILTFIALFLCMPSGGLAQDVAPRGSHDFARLPILHEVALNRSIVLRV